MTDVQAKRKSLSARKATRKTDAEDLDKYGSWTPKRLMNRIADLEAERDRYRTAFQAALAHASRDVARAEKAEAEVERLKTSAVPESTCPVCRFSFLCYRNWEFCPSCGAERRGGRESVTPGGGTSPSGVSPSSPPVPPFPGYAHCKTCTCFEAAAEPAAHNAGCLERAPCPGGGIIEPDDVGWTCDCRCHAAARKEG